MKRSIKGTMFVILAALSLVSTSLMGQSKFTMKMKIPFGFVAGENTFPAGEYTLQTTTAPNAVWFRNGDASKNMVVLAHATQARQTPGESQLRFHRYGERYFLSQILIAGDGTGQELPRSRAEHEYFASAGTTGTVVTLIAGR